MRGNGGPRLRAWLLPTAAETGARFLARDPFAFGVRRFCPDPPLAGDPMSIRLDGVLYLSALTLSVGMWSLPLPAQ
jgi:hypothetical protein